MVKPRGFRKVNPLSRLFSLHVLSAICGSDRLSQSLSLCFPTWAWTKGLTRSLRPYPWQNIQAFSATAWPNMSAFWGWSAVAGSSRGRSPGRPSAMTSAVPPHRSPSSPCASAPLHKAAPLPKALSKAAAAPAPPRPPLGPRAPPVWSQPAVRFGFAPPLALVARAASCGVAAPKVVLRTVLIVSLNKG